MARCIDLFLDAQLEIEALAEELTGITGVSFRPDDEGRYVAHIRDALLTLSGHDFVDDCNLPLSRYRYDISARVGAGGLLDSTEAEIFRHMLASLKATGQFPALLVFDLQYVVEKSPHGTASGGNDASSGPVAPTGHTSAVVEPPPVAATASSPDKPATAAAARPAKATGKQAGVAK